MKSFLLFFCLVTACYSNAQTSNRNIETPFLHLSGQPEFNNNSLDSSGPPKTATEPSFVSGNSITVTKRISNAKMPIGSNGIINTGYAVSTFAGKGVAGNSDDTSVAAMLNAPAGIAVDAAGNVFVADAGNNKIRKITPAGRVSTFAGTGVAGNSDGTEKATFYYPAGVAVDVAGNVYVADKGNHMIRKITPGGVVSTLAGNGIRGNNNGAGKLANFNKPVGIAVDIAGNVYVADQANHQIRKITPNGVVSTLAGRGNLGSTDGIGTEASFYSPSGVAVDSTGNVYVADYGNNRIRKVTPSGLVSTLAGSDTAGSVDGVVSKATFFAPKALTIDATGNIYIADQVNHKIRKVTSSGIVSTIAGTGTAGNADGTGSAASFNFPSGIAVDANENIYVADQVNHKIRKLVPGSSTNKLKGSVLTEIEDTKTAVIFSNSDESQVEAGNRL